MATGGGLSAGLSRRIVKVGGILWLLFVSSAGNCKGLVILLYDVRLSRHLLVFQETERLEKDPSE